MKKILILIWLLAWAPGAFAESWEAEVKQVPPEGKIIVVRKIDAQNGQRSPHEDTVRISSQTELTGIDSLQDLRSGDVVKVNAEKVPGNSYQATSLSISKVDIKEVH